MRSLALPERGNKNEIYSFRFEVYKNGKNLILLLVESCNSKSSVTHLFGALHYIERRK